MSFVPPFFLSSPFIICPPLAINAPQPVLESHLSKGQEVLPLPPDSRGFDRIFYSLDSRWCFSLRCHFTCSKSAPPSPLWTLHASVPEVHGLGFPLTAASLGGPLLSGLSLTQALVRLGPPSRGQRPTSVQVGLGLPLLDLLPSSDGRLLGGPSQQELGPALIGPSLCGLGSLGHFQAGLDFDVLPGPGPLGPTQSRLVTPSLGQRSIVA